MGRSKKWAFVLVVLACLLLGSLAWAQTSPNFDLSWHVVSGGGRDMASTDHSIQGTLGQFAIGPTNGSGYAVGSGYWYGIGRLKDLYQVYLPMILKNISP